MGLTACTVIFTLSRTGGGVRCGVHKALSCITPQTWTPGEPRTADTLQSEVTRETKQALVSDEGAGVSLACLLPA